MRQLFRKRPAWCSLVAMQSTPNSLRLYGFRLSGHSHRAELMLSLLGLPYERIEVNVGSGEHKEPPFLAKNPLGQVPVLEDGDLTLPDSNAILVYLALRYDAERRWYPSEPRLMANVQRWLSLAAGPLAFGPAAARLVYVFGAQIDLAAVQAIAHQLLKNVNAALSRDKFLLGTAPTLADVAMYTYLALAPEGGVSLEPYAHVRGWLAAIEALPRFLAMPRTKSVV